MSEHEDMAVDSETITMCVAKRCYIYIYTRLRVFRRLHLSYIRAFLDFRIPIGRPTNSGTWEEDI
jgi:hypothetical protein